jgi:cyclopropane fatty-acyl-phospholipid synthase-like methyltransferase
VFLVGTDLSENGLKQALLAGYDRGILCDSYEIPLPDKSFDFIISLDVLGHIENEIKDIYLSEWTRLLKDEGVMLHGLETGDIDYDNIPEEVRRHVSIDGHVGLESFQSIIKRFSKFFIDVTAENCMGPCYNWYDIQKYDITESAIGKEFRDYLLTFQADQINAFNAAMLLMRNMLVRENLLGESGGFMFIKAQNKVS